MKDARNKVDRAAPNNVGTRTMAKEIKVNIIEVDFLIELKIFAKIIGALKINIFNKANNTKLTNCERLSEEDFK